jgi:hypothetical protein
MRERNSFPRVFLVVVFLLELVSPAIAQWTPMNPVVAIQPQTEGVSLTMKSGVLRLQVCSDSIMHVLYSPTSSAPPSRPDPVVIKTSWPATKFALQTNDDEVTLTTTQLKVVVTRKDGGLADATGTPRKDPPLGLIAGPL